MKRWSWVGNGDEREDEEDEEIVVTWEVMKLDEESTWLQKRSWNGEEMKW
jgi:hypothetical protein